MYTEHQQAVICEVQEILRQAGLQPTDSLGNTVFSNYPLTSFNSIIINYVPPQPVVFTAEDIRAGKNRLTSRSFVQAIVDHPLGAVLEFPQTGSQSNMAIAHQFKIDPHDERFINPKDNIQYSLGNAHSIHYNVLCLLLYDEDTQKPVLCKRIRLTCRSVKACSFNPSKLQTSELRNDISLDATAEVFMKTLGFFCALKENGCSFIQDVEHEVSSSSSGDEEQYSTGSRIDPGDLVAILQDFRSQRCGTVQRCTGNLLLMGNKFGQLSIRHSCEHYTKGHCNHLWLRNLNEYNITYLTALFNNDIKEILLFEMAAAEKGYGPLVPCDFVSPVRGQKKLCDKWHRNSDNILCRGTIGAANNCDCQFEIYQPNNRTRCPFILVVSRNPHSHINPLRTKTPATIRKIFLSLLEPLEWRLADATPRRLLIDHAFMRSLRHILNWNEFRDPGLGDLHPSLLNSDHTTRLIDNLRREHYPYGTGIDGARYLLEQHQELPPEEQYLRCIETYDLPGESTFHIVVCMFRAMSHLLLQTRRPSIDTSFKRLHKWQEFEIEAWFPEYTRSVVIARAFTTSQSAIAHQYLFRLIFNIVKNDTGKMIHFRHIHGDGIDTVTADGHRGQALGLGLYCQELCEDMVHNLSTEWNKPLYALTPTEHLACFYRYCFTHYTRNISKLRGQVKENVLSAMVSLASAEPLPNFAQVICTIRSGGKKALDWLKDKEKTERLMLAAIYRPLSKIPLEIWKAAPLTSNGNEQAHRNVNRDGTKLTMLAGIMRGYQYDSRAMANIDLWIEECIPSRDKQATHFYRLIRAIRIKSSIQQKLVLAKDAEIQNLYEKAKELQESVISGATAVKRFIASSNSPEKAQKRLRKCDQQLQNTYSQLATLLPHGSGSVPLTELREPNSLFDRGLLEAQTESIIVPEPINIPFYPPIHPLVYPGQDSTTISRSLPELTNPTSLSQVPISPSQDIMMPSSPRTAYPSTSQHYYPGCLPNSAVYGHFLSAHIPTTDASEFQVSHFSQLPYSREN